MKQALVVVDYQNDFVSGTIGFNQAKLLEDKIEAKIKSLLELNGDLIFTMDTHDCNYLNTREGRNLPIDHCVKGTKGWNIHGNINKFLSHAVKVFEKSSFGSLDLALYLNSVFYDQIEFVGVVSDICVMSNVILARSSSPESEIIVSADCIASPNECFHQKSLDIMRHLHVNVLNY